MLAKWLSAMSLDEFRTWHLKRAPWASPGAGKGERRYLDWHVLGAILAAEPPPEAMVVCRGRLVDTKPPTSLAAARAELDAGNSLFLRHTERNDAGLRALAESFAGDLPGRVQVQIFVTPAGTYGFSWHYDEEDVFIVQTEGSKDYYFRENTVDPRPPSDFSRFRGETSQLATARLLPGDCLYIPARWWHMATSTEDSLSISLGVYPD